MENPFQIERHLRVYETPWNSWNLFLELSETPGEGDNPKEEEKEEKVKHLSLSFSFFF